MRDFSYNVLSQISILYSNIFSTNLRVLAYHDVKDSQVFENQIKYLNKNFNIISIDELFAHLYKSKSLPKKSLLITFDDGDYSVYTKGLPILKKYDIPSVLFIITSLINTNKPFWWKKARAHYEDRNFSRNVIAEKINNLKSLPNLKRKNILSEFKDLQSRQLSNEELKQMELDGMKMGNHTHTHPILNKCELESIITELTTPIEYFKGWGLNGYKYFAYPNGNYNNIIENELKINNFKLAFLFDHKINKREINPLRVSRIRVDSDTIMPEFKSKVSGLHSFIYHKFKI